jgi:hypothetical protein
MRFYEIIEAPTPGDLRQAVMEFLAEQHIKDWIPAGGPSMGWVSGEGPITTCWVQALYVP